MNKYKVPRLEDFTLLGMKFEYRHKTKDVEGNEYYTPWRIKRFNKMLDWCGWDMYGIAKLIEEGNIRVIDPYEIEYEPHSYTLPYVGEIIIADEKIK